MINQEALEEVQVNEFYECKRTGKIVEVSRLHDCILTRPVNPKLYHEIKQHTEEAFEEGFSKYNGSLEAVAGFLKEQVAREITVH